MNDTKKIEGFERYLVSPAGKVYSLITNKYLRPNITKGYYRVILCRSGNRYTKRIARLVAQAFILNPENKPEINHIDGIKGNNDISNLEWVTPKENIRHSYETGLRCSQGRPKIPVNVYDYATGKFLSIQPSVREAARMYGLFYQNIRHVLYGRYKHTGGLTFKKI